MRKKVLLNTHADICKLLEKIAIRSADLKTTDLTHFRSIELAMLNCQRLIETMLGDNKKNKREKK